MLRTTYDVDRIDDRDHTCVDRSLRGAPAYGRHGSVWVRTPMPLRTGSRA